MRTTAIVSETFPHCVSSSTYIATATGAHICAGQAKHATLNHRPVVNLRPIGLCRDPFYRARNSGGGLPGTLPWFEIRHLGQEVLHLDQAGGPAFALKLGMGLPGSTAAGSGRAEILVSDGARAKFAVKVVGVDFWIFGKTHGYCHGTEEVKVFVVVVVVVVLKRGTCCCRVPNI